MSLQHIAYDFNQTGFQRDAVLLAMLPYCVIGYDAVRMLFNYRSERWHCVHRLLQQALVEEKVLHIPNSFRSYDVKYLAITSDGLRYLASRYGDLYPWLRHLTEMELDVVTYRGQSAAKTLHRLLQRQQSSLFWSMAGVETIYERMSTQPQRVATAIYFLSNTAQWTPYALAELMQDHPGRGSYQLQPTESTFYDAMEARSLIVKPTDAANKDQSKKDPSIYQANHTGLLLCGDHQKYMVFHAERHGARWSSTPVVKNRGLLRAQCRAINPAIYDDIPARGFRAFLICSSHHEMRHSFSNKRNQWAKRTQYLGQGVSSLMMIPYTLNGLTLACKIMSVSNYNVEISYKLSKYIPGLYYDGLDPRSQIIYNGEPSVACFDMDAVRLRYAQTKLEQTGKVNLFCWQWQVPYVADLLPEATIYEVDTVTGEVRRAEVPDKWVAED